MKIIVLLLLLFSIELQVYGQEKYAANEVSLSYGYFTTEQILDIVDILITVVLTGGIISRTLKYDIGSIFLTYKYNLSEKVKIGLTGGINHSKSDLKFQNKDIGNSKRYAYTIAFESSFSYIKPKKVDVYITLGVGYTFITEKYNTTTPIRYSEFPDHFNFQITPIGFRILPSKVSPFFELGFGYKGIINAGVNIRF